MIPQFKKTLVIEKQIKYIIMKHLRVSNSDRGASVTLQVDMDNWKSQLYVSDREVEMIKGDIKSIHDSVKTNANYSHTEVHFEEVDWYDDEVDVYETPYLVARKGKRTISELENRHGSIPKDWEKITEVHFKSKLSRTTPLFKAIQGMGVRLSDKQIKEIKKDLKKNGYSSVEV